jgi:hypothetical protein
MADEIPTTAKTPARLTPKKDTIRHLFAHSGNVCAFPGCNHPLIDTHGNFVAHICHIEAAEIGGERFNPAMSNEQRRHRDNLLLMCHRHHVETNDVSTWTVEKMRELKIAHERQFEEAVARIAESAISDITKAAVVGQPKTMLRYGTVMQWGVTPDELLETVDAMVCPMLDRLRMLAPDTRAVLLIVVERGDPYDDDIGLPTHELEQVTGLGPEDLWPHIDTMTRYHIACVDEDFDSRRWVATYAVDGWPFWRDLKDYCQRTGLQLSAFVNDLRFDLLD